MRSFAASLFLSAIASVAGVRGGITFGATLDAYTSFHIGGPADVLVEPADVDDVRRLVKQASANKIPVFVVGGTNLLIRDGGIRGIVVSLSKLRSIKEEDLPEELRWTLRAFLDKNCCH